jgi:fluoroquinolone transport system permease protein
MLRWMLLLPLVATLAMRWVAPLLVAQVERWLALELYALYPDLMGYMALLIIPYLWGTISGFLLLDQRDDGTLAALQTTPLPALTYLAYRLALPFLLSALTIPLLLPLTALFRLDIGDWLLLALIAAPQAPLIALLLASLAQNKVQGLALMKAGGLLLMPPLVAYFLPSPWHWSLAFVPTFWPAQLFWQLDGGAPLWLLAGAGLVYQMLLILLLARRFETIMHR